MASYLTGGGIVGLIAWVWWSWRQRRKAKNEAGR